MSDSPGQRFRGERDEEDVSVFVPVVSALDVLPLIAGLCTQSLQEADTGGQTHSVLLEARDWAGSPIVQVRKDLVGKGAVPFRVADRMGSTESVSEARHDAVDVFHEALIHAHAILHREAAPLQAVFSSLPDPMLVERRAA